MDLLKRHTRKDIINIQQVINKVVSYQVDYIAYLSRNIIESLNSSTDSYEGLIVKADEVTIVSLIKGLLNTVVGYNDSKGVYDDMINHTALLNLLMGNLSLIGNQQVPCDRVLLVLTDRDLSTATTDTLVQALSVNMDLFISMYMFLTGDQQGNVTFTRPGIRRLLCDSRTSYQHIGSEDNDFRSWNILGYIAHQGQCMVSDSY